MKYHSYIFFKSEKTLSGVSKNLRTKYETEFLKTITRKKDVRVETYATLGLKVNTQILIWFQANSVEANQNLLNELMKTNLGKHLSISYTLLGMVRPSQYSHHEQYTFRKGGKYLIIYPFTKTQSWYMLDFENRKKLMQGHMEIGRKYPQIAQVLLYSYGVDDFEFIVSYEVDELLEFQTLVMELRSDKVRNYTLKDTPIFTCIYKTPEEVLTFL